MDPLDILTNKQEVIPYYQAIFSADDQIIAGYEVIGRFQFQGELLSLEDFFADDSVPDEYKIEVDDYIVEQALNYALSENSDALIFINRDANLLMLDQGESFLDLLLRFQSRGLNLSRIAIELTEHHFKGDMERLLHLVHYYRTYGIKIAAADIGRENSNLDRIGNLSPDLLKINLQPLRMTSSPVSFNDVLYSISLLARKIGAALLFEDIEANFQLQYAWRNGGRYFQGFYLTEPGPQFLEKELLKEKLSNEFHHFIVHEKKKLETFHQLSEDFYQRIHFLAARSEKLSESQDQLITMLAKELSDCSFRLYICDADGFQTTGNIFKEEDGWVFQEQYKNKNWSWRPYFLENLMKMRIGRRGFFSDLYSDIETGETIRTYSYPLDDGHYLFIDLPYQYLYEQNGML
ncbi:EAL domain-containing protein [Bacillus sp. FJAT-42376]|uniref:EAL domain-containing protein n=1 Tax=Bacillus sp. FJAT-42376 TaxID=2014076 RepID=UPI000F50A7EC|nr:EAL-associated domain-containing protein [Bacillus sp. FJAT-42376]AZB42624.1 EAL domain-containing protein [Bacillus sp. FJAT-42376]